MHMWGMEDLWKSSEAQQHRLREKVPLGKKPW